MTKKKSGLFEATIWYGIGNLFARLVGFILLPLYSNLIPVEQFGIYSLLMSIYAIAGVFYQLGMTSSLTSFYLNESGEQRRKIVFSSIINSIVLIGIGLTFVAFHLSKFFSKKILGSESYEDLVILLFILLFVETVSTFILQLLKTREESKRVVGYLFIGAFLNLVLNIWLVYGIRLEIKGIVLANLFSSLIVLILLIPSAKNDYVFRIEKQILKAVLFFSLSLFLSGIFSAGVDVADRFILDHFFGKEQVGEYSFAYRIAMVVNIFVISFRTAWTPYAINRWNENNYREIFGKTFLKLLAVGVFILLIVSFFANDLFRIKFDDKFIFNPVYEAGLIILPYVVAGYVFSLIASFYSVYPFISGKSYHFLVSDGLGLASNLLLNFILIPKVGLLGAGISTCISFMIIAGYLFFVSKEKVKIEYLAKKNLLVASVGILFLIIGMVYNTFFLQAVLIISFLIFVESFVKIKISRMFRLTQ